MLSTTSGAGRRSRISPQVKYKVQGQSQLYFGKTALLVTIARGSSEASLGEMVLACWVSNNADVLAPLVVALSL
ncbi:hypothetical protein WJX73_008663 [Symbiochloris irregularis]|uniref:Uncharacterized protein n=1 Tax=Symbiochloris irregularis TaxID=706552 RepID=A0AAW1NWX3_9CHLO